MTNYFKNTQLPAGRATLRRLSTAVLLVPLASSVSGQTYTISTFAGGGLPVNIAGTSASLASVDGVAIDGAGNVLIADVKDNIVIRLDATTGVLTRVAGNGTAGLSGDDGPASSSQLNSPYAAAADSAGNIYIVDFNNNSIRKISNGVITTVAGNGTPGFSGDGGPATSAQLALPESIAVDSAGNLYIADVGNNRIRKVSGGVITTVAGNGTYGPGGDNGPATRAQLAVPVSIAVDSAGDLYIADSANSSIRKVSNGVISTIAGNGIYGFSGDGGPAASAQLAIPTCVTLDSSGNLYIADSLNGRIRKVSNGAITTVAGNGSYGLSVDNGPATSSQLFPTSVAVDKAGSLYIADIDNNTVRKVSNGIITTVAGGGTQVGDDAAATGGQLGGPSAVALDRAGNLYIADSANNRIRKVSNGVITTIAGKGTAGFSGDNGPAATAQLSNPVGVAVDANGNLYIADLGNNRIRKVSNGVITTVAGNGSQGFSGDDGPPTSARLYNPRGIAVDSAGDLYIADSHNNRIRRVSNGVITTAAGNGTAGFSGDDGPPTAARLSNPYGVSVDANGNLYIADYGNNRVRRVSNGVISTAAGSGSAGFSGDDGPPTVARLSPTGVKVDSSGNLYIADYGNNRIRRISNGVITTIAGGGSSFGDGGPATAAQLSSPTDIVVDPTGNLFIADSKDNRVRLLKSVAVPTVAANGVVPLYSSVPVIQPGSWVSIYGSNLADGTFQWNGDFPTSLGGVSVTIDNKPAYLWSVSPVQINVQVPDDTATGLVSVVVTTASGTATSTVTLSQYGPSFILLGDARHVAGEIMTPNGTGALGSGAYDLVGPTDTFSFSTRPVKPGETLILYGVGFGPTTPQVPSGQTFSASASTKDPVSISMGGVNASVAFAGITEAGLYQFNLTIPSNVGSGDQALQATINGVQTASGPVVTVQ